MDILNRAGRTSGKQIVLITVSLLYFIVTITAVSPFDRLQIASAAQQENNNTKLVSVSTISTAVGTGAAATGAMVTVPSYLRARKQPKFLATYLLKIHNKYDDLFRDTKLSDKSKSEYLGFLQSLRRDIIYFLQKGDINENQYKLLEDRIAEYLKKINYIK